MIGYTLLFAVSFIFMARAGGTLVGCITRMARFFKLSEFVTAFILMSFATSIPELFIGVSSAIGGVPNMSLGNIIGANFLNITLVIGIVAFLGNGIRVESKISHQNFLLIFFLAFLPILLALDGIISRGDGIVLILAFLLYIYRLIGEKEYFTKILNGVNLDFRALGKFFVSMNRFFLGVMVLVASSALLVWAGEKLAVGIHMNLLSFGVIFVALGTTLPELVFGARASSLKHANMGVGNALGSIAFNSLFIIGVVSLISPIAVQSDSAFFIATAFLFSALLLFNIFIYSRSAISRKESLILISLYFFFIVIEYVLQVV